MQRQAIKEQSRGYIADGHLDLREVRTLYDVQRRLCTSQRSLRDILRTFASAPQGHPPPALRNGHNVAKWREQLEGVEADLELVARLINEYGAAERLE